MVSRFAFVVLSGMAVAVVAGFILSLGMAEAHATGSFHWAWEPDWYNTLRLCLHSPSGQVMYCY